MCIFSAGMLLPVLAQFFIIAQVDRGETKVAWRQLKGIRPFVDRFIRFHPGESTENINQRLQAALPEKRKLKDAIVRLVVEYPREWEPLIDEAALRSYAAEAFEFHLVKRPQMEARIRLPEDQSIGSLNAAKLLDLYWRAMHVEASEIEILNQLAVEILQEGSGGDASQAG